MTSEEQKELAVIEEIIQRVVAEERERCAKIADDFGAKAGNDSSGAMAHIIAQQIRASSEGRKA